jgi:2-dehydropantoate 2-reductase
MASERVAIVGIGAIGGMVAAALQQAGNAELVLCSHRPLTEVRVSPDGAPPIVIDAPVLSDPAALRGGPAAWVMLAVKAHQTAGTAAWLRALCGPPSTVVVLENGVEHEARVAPLIGDAAVLPAIVWSAAEPTAPGQIRLRTDVHFAVPAGAPGAAFAALFGSAARVDQTDDFKSEAWRKLVGNAVGGLMVLAGRRAGMFRDPAVAELARGLANECAAVGRAEGAVLPEDLADQVVDSLARAPVDVGTSILFDREAGRPLEWDARNGVVQRIGVQHGIPTPISDVIVPLLAAASEAVGAAG